MKLVYFVLVFLYLVPFFASADTTTQQQMGMLKQLLPGLHTVTVICNVNDVQPALRELKSAAASSGLELSVFDVKSFPEVYKIFRSLPPKVDLVWMLADSVAAGDKQGRRFLEENCLRKKIPLHAYSEETLHEGALVFVTMQNGQPVAFINKAVSSLIDFHVPAGMESKVTVVD